MSSIEQQKSAIRDSIRDNKREIKSLIREHDETKRGEDKRRTEILDALNEIERCNIALEAALETIEKVEKLGQLFIEIAEAIKPAP